MVAFFVSPIKTAGFFNFEVRTQLSLAENPNSKVLGASTVNQGNVLGAYTAAAVEPQATAAVKALRVVAPAVVANICLPGECGTLAATQVVTNFPNTGVPEATVPGPAGAIGATGPAGVTGATGSTGVDGATGATGAIGADGATGLQGIQGIQGPVGLTGDIGLKGDKGDTGLTGLQGIQGIQGLTGATGATGPQGPIGLTGDIGPKGDKGDTGLTGLQGIQGIQGIQGLPGVSILNTITAATGANAINNGDNAQVWNWALTTNGKTALTFGENTAATSGTAGSQYVLGISTLAGSTAGPLKVSARGNTIIDTTNTGGITLGNTTTNTPITLQSGNGNILIGNDASAKAIIVGSNTSGTTLALTGGATWGIATTGTATGLAISGATNTLSNIGNAALTNSSLTITAGTGLSGGGSVSLGGTTTLSLPNTGTVGTFGSATQVPVITTDAQGRITSVTNTTISGVTVSSMPFSELTSSTNTTATMVVGTGASLNFLGSGTINASTLGGATFAVPGAIGGGTAAAGTFTALTGNTSITSTGLLTASNGLTMTTGALSLTSTSGTISSTGITALKVTLSSGTAVITAPTLNLNTLATGNTLIGNSTGTLTLISSNLNVASTGVVTLNGAQTTDLTTPPATALTVDSGTTGALNLGTGTNAKIVTLGTTNSTSKLNLNAGSGGIFATGLGAAASGHLVVCIDNSSKQLFVGSAQNKCDTSSERFKHDIADIGLGLDAVNELRPVSFTFNDTNIKTLGFIAEQVATVDERLIVRDDQGLPFTTNSEAFLPILTRGIQQLDLKVDGISLSNTVNNASFNNNLSNLQSQVVEIATTSASTIADNNQSLTQTVLTRVTEMINVIYTKTAEFFGKVTFHNDVVFIGRPTFNKDTAGYAMVKTGDTEVKVTFDKEYANEPVVNISLNIAGAVNIYEMPTYVVADINTKGFTVRMNKQMSMDLRFSWMAIAVDGMSKFESTGGAVIPTATPTLVIDATVSAIPTVEVTTTPSPTVEITPTGSASESGSL